MRTCRGRVDIGQRKWLNRDVDATFQSEFFDYPVIDQKTKKRSIFRLYVEALREHGHLLQMPMIASALGVSRQRVAFLVAQGRLASVRIGEHTYIPAAAFELFLTEERKNGRPFDQPSALALLKKVFEK